MGKQNQGSYSYAIPGALQGRNHALEKHNSLPVSSLFWGVSSLPLAYTVSAANSNFLPISSTVCAGGQKKGSSYSLLWLGEGVVGKRYVLSLAHLDPRCLGSPSRGSFAYTLVWTGITSHQNLAPTEIQPGKQQAHSSVGERTQSHRANGNKNQ